MSTLTTTKISETSHPLDDAKVGDGVTINMYSDRNAATIIKHTGKVIRVQRDNATLLNGVDSGESDALKFEAGGFCGHTSGKQRYNYEPNTEASVRKYSRREWYNTYDKKHYVRWVLVGQPRTGESLSEGRNEFYDFNF